MKFFLALVSSAAAADVIICVAKMEANEAATLTGTAKNDAAAEKYLVAACQKRQIDGAFMKVTECKLKPLSFKFENHADKNCNTTMVDKTKMAFTALDGTQLAKQLGDKSTNRSYKLKTLAGDANAKTAKCTLAGFAATGCSGGNEAITAFWVPAQYVIG